MATAAGIPDHAAPSARSSNNVKNCWDSSAWEQTEVHTDTPERESGELSADRSMDWMFKSSTWDWDSVMVFPGRGKEADRRLRSSVCSFPSCTLEAPVHGEEHGTKHDLDQSLAAGNSFTESRVTHGEEIGEIESRIRRRELDHKPSEVEGVQEQRSLASLEIGSCSLSSGCNHGVLCGVEQSEKRDPGEAQLNSTGEDHSQRLCRGFRGDSPLEKDRRRARDEEVQSKEVKIEGNADTFIGLKLGKRTYFEDPTGCEIAKAASISPSPPSFPAKKQRAQSQPSHIPRCQVEGCNFDLSSVKDYHRRHKVCEAHSKSPRVIVAGQEQRFCQQCSRFHLLSEFDVDKRSCRRRLAGHNERRRKPHPDTMAAVAGSVSSFQDHSAWSYGNGPWSKHQSLDDQHEFDSKLQILGSQRQLFHSALSVSSADRLLMLLQNTKRNMISMSSNISCEGSHPYLKGHTEHTGFLSSTPGAEVLAGLAAKQACHSLIGLPDSGSALSLLSSETWAAKSPSSVSYNLSAHTHGRFEQLKVENTHSLSQPQHLLSFHTQEPQADDISTKDLLSVQVQLQSSLSAGNKMHASLGSSVDEGCQQDSCISTSLGDTVGHYESHSLLPLLHGQEFENSQHVGAMLNLMQATSSEWQSAQPSSESGELQSLSPRYTEIQSCRPFHLSIFDIQQI